jgi:hypothetical protein
MGMIDEVLNSTLLKAAMERPDVSEDQWEEIVETAVVQSLPRLTELLWESLEKIKEENLFNDRHELEMFTKRNIFRWREGFDFMDMLSAISLEVGQMVNRDGEAGERPLVGCKHRAVVRLHAKARQIFSEIVCLLKHGFADGALGRWRALHEVAVVGSLLSARDEELARRFLEFRWVESWKGMRVYQDNASRLGLEPFGEEEVREAKQCYDEMLRRYGTNFRGNYGWAESAVKRRGREVTFGDIERAAGIDHLKPYYQWACQKIHVGCNTLHNSLGLMDDEGEQVMVAGPSNAGLGDPAHLAAISLNIATCALTALTASMDVLLGCKVTTMLVEKIGAAFLAAHEKLAEEEAELQRQADAVLGAEGGVAP